MTEEEAKTKWCPYARVVMGDAEEPAIGPFNRDHWINDDNLASTIHRSTCLGSACMAWRWNEHKTADLPVGMAAPEGYVKHGEPRGPAEGAISHRQGWRLLVGGFCGLAGKP